MIHQTCGQTSEASFLAFSVAEVVETFGLDYAFAERLDDFRDEYFAELAAATDTQTVFARFAASHLQNNR